MAAEPVIPWGDEKGKTISEASSKQLKYIADAIEKKFKAGTVDAKFATSNKLLVEAARAELAKRAGGAGAKPAANGKPPAVRPGATPSGAMVVAPRDEVERMQGHYSDPREIAEKLTFIQHNAHLVSLVQPGTPPPAGHALSISVIHIDPRDADDGGDTYEADKNGKKKGLHKNALSRVGMHAGIECNVRRLDDRSDSRYCVMQAFGTRKGIDGIPMTVPPAEVTLDLRDGSDELVGMSDARVLNMRQKIDRHARGRAISNFYRDACGLPTAFTDEQLEKPIVVAQFSLTGDSDDPAIRGMMAQMIAARALGGKEAVFHMLEHQPQLRADSGTAPPAPLAPREPPRQIGGAEPIMGELIEGTKTEGVADATDPAASQEPTSTPKAATPSGSAAAPAKTETPAPGTPPTREPGDDSDALV